MIESLATHMLFCVGQAALIFLSDAQMAQSGTASALSGKIQDFENFGLSPKIADSARYPGSNPGLGVVRR